MRGKVDPHFASWNYPSWTNPYLDPEAIEEERRRLPAAVFDQEYAAMFLDGGRRICSSCAPPEHEMATVLVAKGQELRRCNECERPLDDDGSALGFTCEDGKVHLKIIEVPAELIESERKLTAAWKKDRACATRSAASAGSSPSWPRSRARS